MEQLKKCDLCGKPLGPNKKRFCSPQCLADSMRVHRLCAQCGTEFSPIRKSSKFCSLGCFNQSRVSSKKDMVQPVPVDGARWVPLTQGKWALVDAKDFVDVSRYNWCAVKIRNGVWYAKRTDSPIYMHRYIMEQFVFDGMEVDHRVSDGLDNRRDNLRVATHSQNQMNKNSADKTSKFKGVYKVPSGRWGVRADTHGTIVYGGLYDLEEDAARRYDEIARVHHGNFARLNFPNLGEISAITGEVRKS